MRTPFMPEAFESAVSPKTASGCILRSFIELLSAGCELFYGMHVTPSNSMLPGRFHSIVE